MKKKILIVVIVAILLILLVPIPMYLNDGGSVEYRALLYTVTKYHRLAPMETESGYIDGIGIEILGVEIFNNTDKYNISSTLPYIPDEIEYSRDVKNVTIEVLKDTKTNKSVEILITDNNEDYYGWGVDFKVQKKVNGEWKDLKYVSDDLVWNSIAYVPNKDNQIKQKLDIEKYYGELNKGTYRVAKSVYDKGYVNIYSNEFEIK